MSETRRPIHVEVEEEGSLLVLKLNRPKANVLDASMIAALRTEIREAKARHSLRAVLFESEGPHFSFGASVEEHRPGEVERMLPSFHALFRELAALGLPLLAAVRGYCLGGGLELAAFCHRVFAAQDAQFGNPEIKLGVFAPIASIVLPWRLGAGAATELLLTGRNVDATEALTLGLVDSIAESPQIEARAWHSAHLKPKSAAALVHASRAVRLALDRELESGLVQLETQYLKELMSTKDAIEGIAAFLEKRTPAWNHS